MTRKNFMLLLLVTLSVCLINLVHARGVAVIGSHGSQLSIKSVKGEKYEILDTNNLQGVPKKRTFRIINGPTIHPSPQAWLEGSKQPR